MRSALLLICVLVSCAPPQHSTTSRTWTDFETLAKITDTRVDESSGVCSSSWSDGVFYTHNDSGDSARFFAFDRTGGVLGVYDVVNARPAVDWEDIARAKGFIYCGDIGDNGAVRKTIVVYRVPEPHPPTPSPISRAPHPALDNRNRHEEIGEGEQVRADDRSRHGEIGEGEPLRADRIYTLTYPDGPHNAETLMVNPRSGDLVIVTKTMHRPSGVYTLSHPGKSGAYPLRKVGEVQVAGIGPAKLITGGDISPDGKHVVLRTYFAAWEFDAPAKFEGWIKASPRMIETNADPQGEGICYSRDGREMITTSEGSPCLVSVSKLKK